VVVREGAELLLQKCTIHDNSTNAVFVDGIAVIQKCIMQDYQFSGIEVESTGEVTVSGTTRRCRNGLLVEGKTTVSRSITACVESGVFAWTRTRTGRASDGGGGRRAGL